MNQIIWSRGFDALGGVTQLAGEINPEKRDLLSSSTLFSAKRLASPVASKSGRPGNIAKMTGPGFEPMGTQKEACACASARVFTLSQNGYGAPIGSAFTR